MNARIAVAAVTFDFGNTLVPVDRASLQAVIHETAAELSRRGTIADESAFVSLWGEEQVRQFREEVPLFREVDLDQRVRRVLARLRGMPSPPARQRWDDAAAAELSDPGEIALTVERYSDSFVRRMHPVPDATATIEALASRGLTLGILSNWPLARTVDHFAETQGWTRWLRAIVVSQRVGTIKPHASIFRAAEVALGIPPGGGNAILHVGDDWAADVVGGLDAGWRVAYLRDRQDDTPLPTSEPGDGVSPPPAPGAPTVRTARPDLIVEHLAEIPPLVVGAAGAVPAT